jgi:hypothetical protein
MEDARTLPTFATVAIKRSVRLRPSVSAIVQLKQRRLQRCNGKRLTAPHRAEKAEIKLMTEREGARE